MWDYTDKVREHFLNPRNVGELPDANGIGEVGSLACGDALKLFVKITDEGTIADAKFQTFGCASAIASSSALTEMVKGKTVDEALAITNKDIARFLGGLPKEKMHCSVMGQEALEAAIRNWKGEPALEHEEEGQLVCKCFGITDVQIIRAVKENNLTTVEEVTNYTKAGGGCGDCLERIEQVLKDTLSGKIGEASVAGTIPDFRKEEKKDPPLTNIQRMQKVMVVLDEVIRPRLQQDGGDVDLIDISGNIISVALRGMCNSCPSSKLTIEGVIQQTLREQVEPNLIVKEVQA